jgi:hypothetical protein
MPTWCGYPPQTNLCRLSYPSIFFDPPTLLQQHFSPLGGGDETEP